MIILRVFLCGCCGLLAAALQAQTAGLSDKAVHAAEADVAGMEYFFDYDPGYGRATPFPRAVQGTQSHIVSTEGLGVGVHVLHLRARDAAGNWSAVWSRPVYVAAEVVDADISRMEYFFDQDPGYGQAVPLPRAAKGTHSCKVSTEGLCVGAHLLHLRACGADGNWSGVWSRPVYVASVTPETVRMEYFFDNADPGIGQAATVSLSGITEGKITFNADIASLSAGEHQFNVRAVDASGCWGVVSSEPFTVIKSDGINRVEWDMPVSITLVDGFCTLTAEEPNGYHVYIYGTDGRLLASAPWPVGNPSLSLSTHGASPVIVTVCNERTGRRLTRKVYR